MNSNEGKGLDKTVSQNPHHTAPIAAIAPCKLLINYPPRERMREISAALGLYLAARDGVVFDVPAIPSTDNPTNE